MTKRALFPLGQIVVTTRVMHLIQQHECSQGLYHLLLRHQIGDWGNVCSEDKESNEQGLIEQLRIISSYILVQNTVWIITEADRSITTVLLPDEY